MYQFGIGSLYGVPNGGTLATNPTPVKFGTIKDVSVDFSQELKELKGQRKIADAVAGGALKITGKASAGLINGALLNQLFFAAASTSGMKQVVEDEAHSVPASTPFTVTIAPPGSGTFVEDLGVRLASGASMTKVATGPTTGQYSVSAGVYTFAAADEGTAVLISYLYASTSGSTIAINNSIMGPIPMFELMLSESTDSDILAVRLFSCASSKLSMAFKQDDFVVPEFDFSGYANAAGAIGEIYLSE